MLAQFIESLVQGQGAAAEAKAAKEAEDAAMRAPAQDADNSAMRLFTSEQLASETMPEETIELSDVKPSHDHATNGVGTEGSAAASEAHVAVESGDADGRGDAAEGTRARAAQHQEEAAMAGAGSCVVRERRRGGMRGAESERVEAALGILRGGLIDSAASRNGRG